MKVSSVSLAASWFDLSLKISNMELKLFSHLEKCQLKAVHLITTDSLDERTHRVFSSCCTTVFSSAQAIFMTLIKKKAAGWDFPVAPVCVEACILGCRGQKFSQFVSDFPNCNHIRVHRTAWLHRRFVASVISCTAQNLWTSLIME